jgi:hypothetical protein
MATRPLRIGLDFDNTIVCYDAAIAIVADEMLALPPNLPRTKLNLRNHLRAAGREVEWTEFQGMLYGPGMVHALPFEGAIETMQALVKEGHQLSIVSHRSRRPYAGTPHDLHAAAKEWISQHLQTSGLFTVDGSQTARNSMVNFLETRDAKVGRIAELELQLFIDDLPEVLEAENFPKTTVGVLFCPGRDYINQPRFRTITAWHELHNLLTNL